VLPFSKEAKLPMAKSGMKLSVQGLSMPEMKVLHAGRGSIRAVIGGACLWALLLGMPTSGRPDDLTSVTVLVKDAESGKPVSQAHLTLEFREPGDPAKLKRPKFLSYSAKTNPQGRYRFVNIPKGPVRLIVTAERHQALSKNVQVEQNNAVLEISLKKPQPLL